MIAKVRRFSISFLKSGKVLSLIHISSNNAEEMTTQLDDLKSWGAEAIVAYPQWEGMELSLIHI